MAIAEQEFDELRLRSLTQDFESSNKTKIVLENLGQRTGSEQNPEGQQHLKDPTQDSGSGTPVPVPYYKAEREFKWKILERPGYERESRASPVTGSQGRKARDGQDCQRPPVTGADQSQTAKLPLAPQLPSRFQGQAAQPREAVLIPDDSDGDVEMYDADQSASQSETRLDSSTVCRLRDPRLLGRSRRR